jgi:hypothetical protein
MKSKRLFIVLLIFGLLILTGAGQNSAQAITEIDRNALIDLYNNTNGDFWNNNSGWKTPPFTLTVLPCRALSAHGLG